MKTVFNSLGEEVAGTMAGWLVFKEHSWVGVELQECETCRRWTRKEVRMGAKEM